MSVKQVVIVRRDLKMRRGKEIAQGAHAAMAWLTNRLREAWSTGRELEFSAAERAWVEGNFVKVVVQVLDEVTLLDVYQRARDAGVVAELIVDEGRTEFGGKPTATTCAVGPDEAAKVDAVTGGLALY